MTIPALRKVRFRALVRFLLKLVEVESCIFLSKRLAQIYPWSVVQTRRAGKCGKLERVAGGLAAILVWAGGWQNGRWTVTFTLMKMEDGLRKRMIYGFVGLLDFFPKVSSNLCLFVCFFLSLFPGRLFFFFFSNLFHFQSHFAVTVPVAPVVRRASFRKRRCLQSQI